MGRRKSKKSRSSNPMNNIKKEKKIQARLEKRKQQQQNQPIPLDDNDPILSGSDSGTEEEEENPAPEDLQRLLEAYSKDQLISFLTDAAADDPGLLSHIQSVADQDIAHRKLFIRGIGDATTEALLEAFRPYGPVVGCNIVFDKASGRSKGYGFVVFATRSGAVKALKKPDKMIGTRMVSCHLASIGNVPSASAASSSTDLTQRRVYVSNVGADVSHEKLKAFFATFGELESGPSGYDLVTGKWKGYALFLYKTRDGAARALQEPYKMFEGHQLHCKLAFDHSQKGKLPATQVALQSLPVINQQAALNAMAAAQNAAMLGQNPGYNMLFVQNPLFTNAALNPNSLAALNPAALTTFNPTANMVTPQGQGYGGMSYGAQGHGGVGVELRGSNVFGTYRTQEGVGLSYGGSQLGQSSSFTPATGFFRSFP